MMLITSFKNLDTLGDNGLLNQPTSFFRHGMKVIELTLPDFLGWVGYAIA
jgi:hypothetical protein